MYISKKQFWHKSPQLQILNDSLVNCWHAMQNIYFLMLESRGVGLQHLDYHTYLTYDYFYYLMRSLVYLRIQNTHSRIGCHVMNSCVLSYVYRD